MKIKRFKSENGVVAVIVALSIVALMMVTALTIDVGSLYEERRHLQTVADAAALAGVQELPEDEDAAIDKAIEYASRCGVSINVSDVEVSSVLVAPPLKDTITVNAINPNAELYFARVIGISHTQVVASATAIIASPEVYDHVVPWGVPEEKWKPGEEYVLKWGSGPDGKSYSGNYQPLRLSDKPGGGGKKYKYNIIYGADIPLVVNQEVPTEPGGKCGPTIDGTEERVLFNDPNPGWHIFYDLVTGSVESGFTLSVPDSQFIIVPIIDGLPETHGTSVPVTIVGFVPFIINGINPNKIDDTYGHGCSITGKFLNEALIQSEGGINPVEPGGIKVIRLID